MGASKSSVEPAAQQLGIAKPSRPVFGFEIPEELANGVKSIGLIQLTADEERMAVKRAGGDAVRLIYEQVMQSLVEVNGAPVGLADGSADKAMNSMDPRVRNLVLTAFSKLHAPPEEAVAGFLKSQTVRVA